MARFFYRPLWIPILIGTFFFLALGGGRTLNPEDISWISLGDPSQHYLGWEFFRLSKLQTPPGLNPFFGAEVSSSIVYSDSIPIVAIILKLFDSYLSRPFQYLGLWYLLSFIMQSLIAWKISELFVDGVWLKVINTCLLAFCPAFLNIVGTTAALSTHFLILTSIYLTLRPKNRYQDAYWGFLTALSLGIHFYLYVMVIGVWVSDTLDRVANKDLKITRSFITYFSAIICMNAALFWVYGYLATGGSATNASGYGIFPNQLDPLSIIYDRDWSYIESLTPELFKSHPSSNYLGFGLLLAFILVGIALIKKSIYLPNFYKKRFLVLLCVFLTLFSLSNNLVPGAQ